MEITTEMVKALRERTGAGVMDCKEALRGAGGDFEEAVRLLREKGLAAARKKEGRAAGEGLVGCYVHHDGRVGALVEVNCETDFVARTSEFQELARDLAMHVAAARPQFVSRDQVPPEVLEQERQVLTAQTAQMGKPEAIVRKIVEGRLEKFFRERCLLEQPFVKDPERDVGATIAEKVAKLGENVRVRRFVRFQ
ncbi:MAG: translation elongation factor Ts, partial [Nitrospinota bacterium]